MTDDDGLSQKTGGSSYEYRSALWSSAFVQNKFTQRVAKSSEIWEYPFKQRAMTWLPDVIKRPEGPEVVRGPEPALGSLGAGCSVILVVN